MIPQDEQDALQAGALLAKARVAAANVKWVMSGHGARTTVSVDLEPLAQTGVALLTSTLDPALWLDEWRAIWREALP